MSQEKTKGFVIVASKKNNFYLYAINLAESILDYYPEANITLFCEEWMFRENDRDIFDQVIFCGGHYRQKLQGIADSPYDLTMYVDADMGCEHEDIATVFDQLGDYDIMFTPLLEERAYIYTEYTFDTPHGKDVFKICGGVCLYDKTKPIVREFLNDWWSLTKDQMDGKWWPEGYPDSLKAWDQFGLYWLTEHEPKYKDLKVGFFEDDLRWNWFNAWNPTRTVCEKPVILRHYSSGLNKDDPIV